MTEPPDLSQLAKRYIELWQDYLTAAAADPDLIDSLARLFAGMGVAASLWPGSWPRRRDAQAGDGGCERDGPPGWGVAATPDAAPPRAAAASAALGERADDLARLARRLAALDERLARLEAGSRQGARGARRQTRRRRS